MTKTLWAHKSEKLERNLENFRGVDLQTKKFVNRIIYYDDETVYDGLRRRVQRWEEPGFILCQSLEMPVGSGKTSAGIYTAFRLDPDFSIESIENFTFGGKDFLSAVKNIKKGQVVCNDEGGLNASDSRKFQSALNQTLNSALRLARFRQGYVLIMLPLATMIDLRVRLLCSVELEMIYVHHARKLSYGVFRTLSQETDKRGRYIFLKKLPVIFRNEKNYTFVDQYSFPKIPDKIWSQYLKRKDEALANLDVDESDESYNEHTPKISKADEVIDFIEKECQGIERKEAIDKVMTGCKVQKRYASDWVNACYNQRERRKEK